MTLKKRPSAVAPFLCAVLAFSLCSNRVAAQSVGMEPLRPLSEVMERVETEDARLYIAMTCQAIYWMDTGGGLMEPILFFTEFARQVYERRGVDVGLLRSDLDRFTQAYTTFAQNFDQSDRTTDSISQQVRSDRDVCRQFLEN